MYKDISCDVVKGEAAAYTAENLVQVMLLTAGLKKKQMSKYEACVEIHFDTCERFYPVRV
jgi:hypothetical protein